MKTSSATSDNTSVPRPQSRRSVLSLMASLAAGAVFTGLHSCSMGSLSPGSRYRDALCSVLDTIESTEIPAILECANLLATAQLTRRHCFIRLGDGTPDAQRWSLPAGLPPLYVPLVSEAMAAAVRPGDVLITTDDGDIAQIARSRGATIIGITSPVVADRYESQDRDRLAAPVYLNEFCDLIIDTHIPVWDGLVEHPSYPFRILPGSGVVMQVVVAMLAGEAFHRAGGLGRTTSDPPSLALEYLDVVRNRIVQLGSTQPTSAAVTDQIHDSMIHNGTLSVMPEDAVLASSIHGHAGIPAGIHVGMPETQPHTTIICADRIDYLPLLYHAATSNISGNIILIGGAETADTLPADILYYSTHSPEPDGVLQFDHGRRYLSTASVLNEVALWSLVGDATDRALDEGFIPPFLMGAHLSGSDEYNRDIRRRFSQAAQQ